MTREIAHFKMFEAALDTIQPNFPPGILQGDPRYSHTYMNMSNGIEVREPWEPGESWDYVQNPQEHVVATQGLIEQPIKGTDKTPEQLEALGRKLGEQRSQEIKSAIGGPSNQWSTYPQTAQTSPTKVRDKKN